MYTALSVTEICLQRNAADVHKAIIGMYTVRSVTEICLLRNAVDVQSLLLVCILC